MHSKTVAITGTEGFANLCTVYCVQLQQLIVQVTRHTQFLNGSEIRCSKVKASSYKVFN